jgi:hypothetical protein
MSIAIITNVDGLQSPPCGCPLITTDAIIATGIPGNIKYIATTFSIR